MAKARNSINQMYPGMYRFRGPEPGGSVASAQAAHALQMQMAMMMQAQQQAAAARSVHGPRASTPPPSTSGGFRNSNTQPRNYDQALDSLRWFPRPQ